MTYAWINSAFSIYCYLKNFNWPIVMFALNSIFNTNFLQIISSVDEDFPLDLFSCREVKSSPAEEKEILVRTSGIKLVL